MGRSPRDDEPGSWHHVGNRALARRPLFEHRDDLRWFLAKVAQCVHRGWIEVHAYCLLTTHFHLLVKSPLGCLALAMQRIENGYVRRYNMRRFRDGPLVRGRYFSRRIDTAHYMRTVWNYVDQNPVDAGLATSPWDYAWCSAKDHVRGPTRPWLSLDWTRAEVEAIAKEPFSPSAYRKAYLAMTSDNRRQIVERRLKSRSRIDPLDHLVGAAPPKVQEWLRENALLADGTDEVQPVVSPASVLAAVNDRVETPWQIKTGGTPIDARTAILTGLLRDLCGCRFTEISTRLSRARSTCQHFHRSHRRLILEDLEYMRLTSEITAAAVRVCYGNANLLANGARHGSPIG